MSLPTADYPQPAARAQLYQRLLEKLRGVAGVQGASAMSGLPPNRPLNANDTDIDNYTAPPEGPFENVDYYQNVMTDYFETMGIPIVQGAVVPAERRASSGLVVDRQRNAGQHVLEGRESDRPAAAARLRPFAQVPWFTVIGVAKDVKQGGVDQEDRHRVLFPRRSDRDRAAAVQQRAGHDEHRAAHDAAAGDAAHRRSKAPCARPIRRCRSSGCAT